MIPTTTRIKLPGVGKGPRVEGFGNRLYPHVPKLPGVGLPKINSALPKIGNSLPKIGGGTGQIRNFRDYINFHGLTKLPGMK